MHQFLEFSQGGGRQFIMCARWFLDLCRKVISPSIKARVYDAEEAFANLLPHRVASPCC